jgi:hypothetical protein
MESPAEKRRRRVFLTTDYMDGTDTNDRLICTGLETVLCFVV